jgi:hypothetical protein
VQNFCQVSVMLERTYARLAEVDDLMSPRTGELRNSVDVLRRLSDTHRMLGRELKLSPLTAPTGFLDLAASIADKVE